MQNRIVENITQGVCSIIFAQKCQDHTPCKEIMIYTHSMMFIIIMRLQTVRYVQTCGEWSTGHGVQGYDTVGYDVKGRKCSLCTDLKQTG